MAGIPSHVAGIPSHVAGIPSHVTGIPSHVAGSTYAGPDGRTCRWQIPPQATPPLPIPRNYSAPPYPLSPFSPSRADRRPSQLPTPPVSPPVPSPPRTPQMAAGEGHPAACEALLGLGGDVHAVDCGGESAARRCLTMPCTPPAYPSATPSPHDMPCTYSHALPRVCPNPHTDTYTRPPLPACLP